MNPEQSSENGITRLMKWSLLALLIILVASIVVLSLVPPVSKDALVHHLAVPKLYLKRGGMYEIPTMPFSYFPMNLHLLYMIPLYFGNDIIPKFIHFSFALLTAWLIFGYLRLRLSTIYGLLGVIFFLSVPIIVKLSINVYVDLGLIFFSTASLLCVFRWIESGFQKRFLALSAIFCGLGMGTKYNGLIILFLLALFVPFLYVRHALGKKPGFIRATGQGLVFLFVSLLVFSPWMLRNHTWKRNPIYPLYDRWFNPPVSISEAPAALDIFRTHDLDLFTYRAVIYQEKWWQIALLPIRIFFQGEDGSHQYFDGKLNPFLLFLPIFAFYRMREGPRQIRNEKLILLSFVVLFFAFTFFSSETRVRYISPIIPPLVILSIFGARELIGTVNRLPSLSLRGLGKAFTISLMALCFLLNAAYVKDQFRYVAPFSYLSQSLSRDEYLSKYRSEYPAFQYINIHLPPDALILFIFIGKRGYYCDRDYIVLGEGKLRKLVSKSEVTEEIVSGLKNLGVTHLFLHNRIFEKWVEQVLNKQETKKLNRFLNDFVKLIYTEGGYSLYHLKGP